MTESTPTSLCKRKLAILWFFSTGLLFTVMILQTIFGHYGENAIDAWSWFLPSVMPTLSLILGVLVTDAMGKGVQMKKVNTFVYRLAFSLSAVYLISVSLSIFFQPFSSSSPIDLMRQSNLWLAPLQGLVAASLGAFFIYED